MPKTAAGALTLALALVAVPTAASATPSRDVYISSITGAVSQFHTDADGQLAGTRTDTVSAGGEGLAFSPDGRFLYGVDAAAGIRVSAVGADGSLTPLAGPAGVDDGKAYGVAVSPDGRFLFATQLGSGSVRGYAIGADGTLSTSADSAVLGLAGPIGLVVAPDSRHLFVTDVYANTVTSYAIATDGTLTAERAPVATGSGPYAAQLTPDGRRLYVVNY